VQLIDSWPTTPAFVQGRYMDILARLAELVGELSVRSDRFRRLWARHDIEVAGTPARTFNHPLVGSIELKIERLAISGAEGQLLIVHHADPGGPAERALTLLAGIAAR
jgi:hypothetical protein